MWTKRSIAWRRRCSDRWTMLALFGIVWLVVVSLSYEWRPRDSTSLPQHRSQGAQKCHATDSICGRSHRRRRDTGSSGGSLPHISCARDAANARSTRTRTGNPGRSASHTPWPATRSGGLLHLSPSARVLAPPSRGSRSAKGRERALLDGVAGVMTAASFSPPGRRRVRLRARGGTVPCRGCSRNLSLPSAHRASPSRGFDRYRGR